MIHDRHSVRQQPSPTSVRGAVVTAFRTEDGGSIAPGFLERLSTKRCPLGSESRGGLWKASQTEGVSWREERNGLEMTKWM